VPPSTDFTRPPVDPDQLFAVHRDEEIGPVGREIHSEDSSDPDNPKRRARGTGRVVERSHVPPLAYVDLSVAGAPGGTGVVRARGQGLVRLDLELPRLTRQS